MALTLVQLRHFVTLASARSFVRASAMLYMTQPALSRSIKALEDDLGQALFDRTKRRVELTPFGQQALPRARLLIEDAQGFARLGRGLDALDGGRFRLGLSSGPGILLSRVVMDHFAKRYQNLHVDIVRANTEALTLMLRERQVDALVVDVRSLRPAADLAVSQITEMKGAFLCRPGHPLARQRTASFARLLDFPVVSTPLSDELARILVERYGALAHPERMIRMTSDELSHLADLARGSDAILFAIRACAPDLVEVKLKPALEASARYGLVTLAGRTDELFVPELRRIMDTTLRDSARQQR
jgi:DNA-binding transcriptional LysR family regulator